MISRTDKKFKVLILFMSALLLLTSIFPVLMQAVKVSADSTRVVTFDSSCVGQVGSTYGWEKDMLAVYYYAYSSSGNTGGLQAMTKTNKSGTDGGKLFTASIDSSYTYIIFSSQSEWTHIGTDNYRFQTQSLGLAGSDGKAFILNSNGYNDSETGTTLYKQGMYTYTLPTANSYAGRTFNLLNMTNDSVTLYYRFTDEQKPNGSWAGRNTITYASSMYSVTLNSRSYDYQAITVDADAASGPYSSVEIFTVNNASADPINRYNFDEGKILDRTYAYGVSQLANGTVISYQTENPVTTQSVNEELYLDNGFAGFTSDGSTVNGTGTTHISKEGNSNYVTSSSVSIGGYTASNADANLSGCIITVVDANGNSYNVFGPKKAGDNLIIVNDNVAEISGKYTVQSTHNVLNENGNTYKYVTTQADFYDYQYDHNSITDDNYTYSYSGPRYLVFTKDANLDSLGTWNDVYAYFYSGGKNNSWPGVKMDYLGVNENSQHQYKAVIPPWATTAIVNNGNDGNKNQTVDISLGSGTDSVGAWSDFKGADAHVPIGGTWKPEQSFNEGSASLKGKAKRPYLTINEAISGSDYASNSSNYPMYLGQFWLPKMDSGYYNTSEHMYTSSTTGQRAGHNGNDDKYYYSGLTDDFQYNYGFGNPLTNFNWSANLAFRYADQAPGTYEPYDAVVQGLVNKTLRRELNGKYTLMANDNSNTIPYFDTSWWDRSYTNSDGKTGNLKTNKYIKEYDNLSFPFFETAASDIKKFEKSSLTKGKLVSDQSRNYEGTYYVFDSTKNVIRLNDSKDDLLKYYDVSDQRVGDNYGNGVNTHSETGLFPFNSNADIASENLHYGFGVKFSIDFYLNDNGTLDGTTSGIPITFTFQGDDDVWVFLDDKLVLDMGGAHKNSIGEINFADRKVYIGAASGITNTAYVSSAVGSKTTAFSDSSIGISDSSDYVKTGKHKITMYYLERGMLNSNLYVMFNLPMSLTKYELQEDTDFTGVNQGFRAATRYVADQDVFNYKVENKGTTNVVGSDYSTPTTTSAARTNNESSNRSTTLAPGSGTAHTYNFDPSTNVSGGYAALTSASGGVTYKLTEPHFGGDAALTYDTRSVTEGTETHNGVISLQYGELATLSKQFNYSSAMKVTQLDTLSAPSSGSRATAYNDSTGRSASKYYTTYMKSTPNGTESARREYAGIYDCDDVTGTAVDHVETMYGGAAPPTNYSMNSIINLQVDGNVAKFNFNDPTNAADEYVHIRQVVVNQVKTVDLVIRKDFIATETYTTPFDFKIHFKNIFGRTEGDSEVTMNEIKYTMDDSATEQSLGNDGSFSLATDHYITIKGIPVGTQFYLEETTVSETYELDKSKSFNIGDAAHWIDLDNNTEALMRNSRKIGRFTLNKEVYNEEGTATINDNTEFTAVVSLTAPSGVDLSQYDIKANGNNVTFNTETTIFETGIKKGTPVVITGLPYGTAYSVSEGDVPGGYAKFDGFSLTSGYTRISGDNVEYSIAAKQIHGTGDTDGNSGIVNVYNCLNPIIMPETGGTPLIYLLPFGIIAIALSGAAIIIYKKKLQGYSLLFGRKRR